MVFVGILVIEAFQGVIAKLGGWRSRCGWDDDLFTFDRPTQQP